MSEIGLNVSLYIYIFFQSEKISCYHVLTFPYFNFVIEGGSSEKINLGLSFYGRSFAGATGLNAPHTGSDKANWSVDDGTPQYCKFIHIRVPTCFHHDQLCAHMCVLI